MGSLTLQTFKDKITGAIKSKDLILPSNVKPEMFRNSAIVAVQDNPSILNNDPASLFAAVRKLAASGLVPDNREAALVPFKGKVQAMPMVFGLIKMARNSGEIASLYAEVVYEGEEFDVFFKDGERLFDHKYDALNRGGAIKGAYAVARLKDGTVEFEPMGVADIEKRRKASANQKGDNPTGIWAQWYDEMAKKTVIRALMKRLPVSSEDLRRIQESDDPEPIKDVTPEDEKPKQSIAAAIQGGTQVGVREGSEGGTTDDVEDAEIAPELTPDPMSSEYDEGFAAAQAESDGPCPYDGGTQQNADWQAGFKYFRANVGKAAS